MPSRGCPTCGGMVQRWFTWAKVGKRYRVRSTAWQGSRRAGGRPVPVRLYWPVEVTHGHRRGVCPDSWHDEMASRWDRPKPRPNGMVVLNQDRVNAPKRRKQRTRRHRVAQGKDRR